MKQKLFKSWLLMMCLLFGVGQSWAADITVTKTISDVVSENKYTVSSGSTINTKCTSIDLDENINVSVSVKEGATGNTGTFWGTSPSIDWRLYQGDEPAITVSAATGYNIKSVKFTYTNNNNGVINTSGTGTQIKSENQVASNSANTVNATSATYYVGNTVSKTNGQARITAIEVVYASVGSSDSENPTVTAPIFDVAAGTYTEDQLVLIDNYNSDYIYAYTLDGTDPAFDENLDVTNGTKYDNDEGIEITSSCTLKVIAVDGDGNTSSITSAAYEINKPQVFASLEELVAADLESGTNVTVSFNNVAIKSFYKSGNYTNGVFFDIQKEGNDIEIYYKNVPSEWVVGGTLSGKMTCPWKKYNGTWELAPASGWAWTNLTYTAPAQKTITALEVSGNPNKTTYNVGDEFDPAGLVVTATYSDGTTASLATGFEWEIDYGKTGEVANTALVAGATSVDVMVYTDDVMSEVYTVNGLTVTVPVTLTSIAISGAPTKTEYYAGDAFETAGLVVTGTYSDGSKKEITEGIEWLVEPQTLSVATSSVEILASVGDKTSDLYIFSGLTVTENPYHTATISSFSVTSGDINSDISYEASQGESSTAPAVYSNNLRLYQNGGYVTIKAKTGLKIASVKISTGVTYASTTVGYCVDDEDAPTTGETVAKNSDYTISGLDNNSVSIYCLGTDKNTRLDIAAIEVKYSGTAVAELKSIEISGTYPTEFTQGDEFSHEGLIVTANYTNDTNKDVTSEATFTSYDMSKSGEQTVTVSYTEEGITMTATYTISVARKLTSAAEGYETVDFTAIEPYKSLATNGSASIGTYEGGSSFTMEFAKKQGTNNEPKFYQNGNAVRAYTDNTLTITAAEPIKYVDIAWVSGYVDDAVSITGLETTTAVVTFSKTCRFTAITVSYKEIAINILTDEGYATFVSKNAVKLPEGLTAAVAEVSNGQLAWNWKYDSGSTIPAKTPVLVKGSKGEHTGFATAGGNAPESNYLFANMTEDRKDASDIAPGSKYYFLSYGDEGTDYKNKLGFYYYNENGASFEIPVGKVFLALPSNVSGSAKAAYLLTDDTTAISSIENTSVKNNVAYNLAGQRVETNAKGIVIINGRKYLNK